MKNEKSKSTRRGFIRQTAAAAGAFTGVSAISGSSVRAHPAAPAIQSNQGKKPNLVLIMTDNQGPWTLGCYGNPDIRTPHIDRLATEGIRFDRAYCNNPVCSPGRATTLTGLVSSQTGVHSFIPQSTQIGPDAYNTIEEFPSLPKILSANGYTCGLTGKWHLGDNINPQEGFTYWFTKVQGGTSTFYDDEWIWEGEIYREPRYTTDAITEHAIQFLEQSHEDPFFLYLPYNGPYGLGQVMREVHQNRHTAYYSDKNLDSFPREKPSPWLFNNRDMINNLMSIRSYAAALSGVDDGVGRVMDTLKRLGKDEDTIVVFTADQGWSGGHGGYWGMGDHTRPMGAREQMVTIPFIFRHPGGIPAGQTSDIMTCNYDFLPTILSHMGLESEIPSEPRLCSREYSSVLKGQRIPWDNTIFYEYENLRMVRTEDYKLTLRHPDGPDELYDMKENPTEKEEDNLIHVAEFQPVREELTKQLNAFFDEFADPKYDLWKGGMSKAARLTNGC